MSNAILGTVPSMLPPVSGASHAKYRGVPWKAIFQKQPKFLNVLLHGPTSFFFDLNIPWQQILLQCMPFRATWVSTSSIFSMPALAAQ